MNRGSLGKRHGGQVRVIASMRPRFMNRGSADVQNVRSVVLVDASMRPRFMNRGSYGPRPCTTLGRAASMRPRFMNRGSDRRHPEDSRIAEASMRPRFMNRGSMTDLTRFVCGLLGFNEAPIHESGKCHPPLGVGVPASCFNEAPIHESGKFMPPITVSSRTICFNEAPIHESGKWVKLLLPPMWCWMLQ